MRPATALLPLLLLPGLLLAGCRGGAGAGADGGAGPSGSPELDRLRDAARAVAGDPQVPMARRVEAFEALRQSFPSGTPEELVVRYLDPETRTRLREGYDGFVLHVVGPDGREKWLTIVNGRLSNDPQKER